MSAPTIETHNSDGPYPLLPLIVKATMNMKTNSNTEAVFDQKQFLPNVNPETGKPYEYAKDEFEATRRIFQRPVCGWIELRTKLIDTQRVPIDGRAVAGASQKVQL